MQRDQFDLVVIGGGINGAGIARDAAGRGLSVLLCEQDDLASGTSSASTKLIHGGLRYLEHYEFRLVREALIEREVLLRAAPHIIWPMRFVLPYSNQHRPVWMIRAGLFLYDHLGGRKLLPGSSGIDLHTHVAGGVLRPELRRAFVYSDCWVQDARLVVLNCIDAAERGAEILTRTRCTGARRNGAAWQVTLERDGAPHREVTGRALVNAAGPWVATMLGDRIQAPRRHRLRLVKGSHIVVPRLFDHDYAYIFQQPDKRIVFAIPYEQEFTLIGTTDESFEGDPKSVAITETEVTYLCEAVNPYFRKPVSPTDIVWTYAGVRPLQDDGTGDASAVTRDYVLDLEAGSGQPALLSVFGGKITTYRRLAEHALRLLKPHLGLDHPDWTESAALPGGDIPDADYDAFHARFTAEHPWLPPALAERLTRAYGTRANRLLGDATSTNGLGEHLGDGLYAAELDYLVDQEWACTAEDVLWRRSKLGLHVSPATVDRVTTWFDNKTAPIGAGSNGHDNDS